MDFVQNGMTKNLGRNFIFFNRGILGQKLRQKVASPISGKNTQMIACWYKTHIQRKEEKTKNFSFVCKHQPKIGIHEPGLGDDVWSELVKELCWSKAITLGRQSKVTQERCEPNMCLLILTLWSKW